jgi:exonuclease III
MKLLSLNIEKRRHLEKVATLLNSERPDVVCLQEVSKRDIKKFENLLHMKSHFVPLCYYGSGVYLHGIGLFAKQIDGAEVHWLAGRKPDEDLGIQTKEQTREEKFAMCRFSLLTARVVISGKDYTIATTHLPATKEAAVTDYQLEAVNNLLKAVGEYDDMALCGDFNAPRGGQVFNTIATVLKGNIPSTYTSSLDPDLHRAGPLPYMVDGLFTKGAYQASDVELRCGVSDHCAIIANLFKEG